MAVIDMVANADRSDFKAGDPAPKDVPSGDCAIGELDKSAALIAETM